VGCFGSTECASLEAIFNVFFKGDLLDGCKSINCGFLHFHAWDEVYLVIPRLVLG